MRRRSESTAPGAGAGGAVEQIIHDWTSFGHVQFPVADFPAYIRKRLAEWRQATLKSEPLRIDHRRHIDEALREVP
jgi:hypothetical protein